MSDVTQWQLLGSAAELYERYLVPVVTQQWAVDLVARARLRHEDRVLDLACGTGVVARVAAREIGRHGCVAGLDLNPEMLAIARSASEQAGVSVEWHEGSATALPFDEAAFDVVLCQLGLQFFSDRAAALQETKRVLVPGGRFCASVFAELAENPVASALSDALDRCAGEGVSLAKRHEHALGDVDELHSLIAAAEFSDVRIETVAKTSRYPSVADYVLFQFAATPLATVLHDRSAAEREGLVSCLVGELGAALGRSVGERDFAFPQVAHVVSAVA